MKRGIIVALLVRYTDEYTAHVVVICIGSCEQRYAGQNEWNTFRASHTPPHQKSMPSSLHLSATADEVQLDNMSLPCRPR